MENRSAGTTRQEVELLAMALVALPVRLLHFLEWQPRERLDNALDIHTAILICFALVSLPVIGLLAVGRWLFA